MSFIDLNADLGEADTSEGVASELAILDYVSSASIACGGHAGTRQSMTKMIKAAKEKGVVIGAHPSYPDRDNFGRLSKVLGQDILEEDLIESVSDQIRTLIELGQSNGLSVSYVKPHGALYNDAVKNLDLSDLLGRTVKAIDPLLWFMGAPGSEMEAACERHGISFAAEGFIDRKYTDAGHLVSRSKPGAVLESLSERESQLSQIIKHGTVNTETGRSLKLNVETLCLHGDSDGASYTAEMAHRVIRGSGYQIRSFIHE